MLESALFNYIYTPSNIPRNEDVVKSTSNIVVTNFCQYCGSEVNGAQCISCGTLVVKS